jgi:hypothetical protein
MPARQEFAHLRYFWAIIQVRIATLVVVFAAAIACRLIFAVLVARSVVLSLFDAALILAAAVLVPWPLLRLCLVLPAAALGHRLSLRAGWQATAHLSIELLRIILQLGAINLVGGALASGFGLLPDALSLLLSFPVDCALMLLSASVISALYDALVQGRTL